MTKLKMPVATLKDSTAETVQSVQVTASLKLYMKPACVAGGAKNKPPLKRCHTESPCVRNTWKMLMPCGKRFHGQMIQRWNFQCQSSNVHFKHKARKVNDFQWPSQNPDLNQICDENLWVELKRAVCHSSPQNLTELKQFSRESANIHKATDAKVEEN